MENWGDLPHDLLNLIIHKLDLTDHLSFSSVNTIWRSTGLEYRRNKIPTNVPGLIIPGGTTSGSQTRRFLTYPTSYNKTTDYSEEGKDLPVLSIPHVRLCRGSYKGWLALIDNSLNMYLENPYLKSCIKLPRASKLPHYNVLNHLKSIRVNKWFVRKVFLSNSPSSSGEVCYVVAIYRNGVAFCTIQGENKEWKTMDFPKKWAISQFSDGIFFKGKFYLTNNGGQVYVSDLTSPYPRLSQLGASTPMEYGSRLYLVEVGDDLFQILREVVLERVEIPKEDAVQLQEIDKEREEPIIYSEDNNKYTINGFDYDNVFDADLQNPAARTVGFAVFKLENNGSEQKWARVEHLNGAAVFLGYNQTWSVHGETNMMMAGYERDTIYYADDNAEDERYRLRSGSDMGVYRLHDSSFRPLYLTNSRSTKPHAVWFTPMPT